MKNLNKFLSLLMMLPLVFHMGMAQKVPLEQGKSYTLLGLGDSITEGGNNFSSYLYPLWKKLYLGGYQVEFVGPNQADTKIGGIAHAGFSGRNAAFLATNIDSLYRQFPADIVLLHAGHNHFTEENPVEGIVSALTSIVGIIKNVNPEAIILIAKVIESGKLPKYSYIPQLNERIEQMVSEAQQSYTEIYLVDQAKGFNWKEDTIEDKVHPNASGAAKMATIWYEKLETVLEKPSQSFNPTLAVYKKTVSEELQLHIFEPSDKFKNDQKACIIFFFGGGWKVGSPLQFYREAAYLASKGIVAISADYRTAFENGTTPIESLQDAKSAIRWLRKNAQKYGIDPSKIAAAGASAGGYLAAATGTVEGFEEPEEDHLVSSRPNLNLLYYPVLDLGPDGYDLVEMKEVYKEISPYYAVNNDTPPTLILLGTEDPYLSVENAKHYKNKLNSMGVGGELKLYQGAGHPIFYYRKSPSEYYELMLHETETFLNKHNYLMK